MLVLQEVVRWGHLVAVDEVTLMERSATYAFMERTCGFKLWFRHLIFGWLLNFLSSTSHNGFSNTHIANKVNIYKLPGLTFNWWIIIYSENCRLYFSFLSDDWFPNGRYLTSNHFLKISFALEAFLKKISFWNSKFNQITAHNVTIS